MRNGSIYRDRRQPVPGAVVIISSKDGRTQRRTRTNAQGGFTFSGLPAGSYVLQGSPLIQISGPNSDGVLQIWPVEWQSADELKPDTLKVGDQVVVTGSVTRRNTIDLVSIRRMRDGFSWGDSNAVTAAPSDGMMFVSSNPN